MDRGDVYRSRIYLPERIGQDDTTTLIKWCVVLQSEVGSFIRATDVAVVIASTDRSAGRLIRPFEVRVGTAEGFSHDTVIDCRLVYSFQKTIFNASDFRFRLNAVVMERVSDALAVGLQFS